MQNPDCHPQLHDPRRLLAHTLGHYQMPCYSTLASYLTHCVELWDLRRLYQTFLGRPAPNLWLAELEYDFIAEVDRTRFPVDLTVMEQILYDGDHGSLLGLPIPLQGQGISCQGMALPVNTPAWPLIALLLPCLVQEEQASVTPTVLEALARWWADLGYDGPQPTRWLTATPDQISARLAALPAPLDGLATTYLCLRRQSGNPFLDWTDEESYDAAAMLLYTWCSQDLHELTGLYQNVAPALRRLAAYETWWTRTYGAARLVGQTLLAGEALAVRS